jgi:hypothetical protein
MYILYFVTIFYINIFYISLLIYFLFHGPCHICELLTLRCLELL